ncbi:hypothetical protein V8V91_20150 [Algoriphagus halophilus]|uniref:hypothetical protein n=1 Tax=Algoriphagus halophilus TaxID=226505 RepID=UPI00358F7CA8
MRINLTLLSIFLLSIFSVCSFAQSTRNTKVEIKGNQFLINDQPTYPGRVWKGNKIEGLLMNSRMVQGVFDDLNPETIENWEYPDTQIWDPDRNTREFVEQMPIWKSYGLLSFTINLQGESIWVFAKPTLDQFGIYGKRRIKRSLFQSIGKNTGQSR